MFVEIYYKIIELLAAPKHNPDMIWMVTPLLFTLILTTFYFGRYTGEELGWNTALGNSIVLLFISIDMVRQIFNGAVGGILHPSILNFEINPIKTAIAMALCIIAIILMMMNFMHAVPKKISFFISSPLAIILTAYIAMTIVYTNVVFNWITFLAAVVLFFFFLGIIQLIKLFERIFLKWAGKPDVEIISKK